MTDCSKIPTLTLVEDAKKAMTDTVSFAEGPGDTYTSELDGKVRETIPGITKSAQEAYRLSAANPQGDYSVGVTFDESNWTYTYNGQQWGLSDNFDLSTLPYQATELDPNDDANLAVRGSDILAHENKQLNAHNASAINWDEYEETAESVAKNSIAKRTVSSQRTGRKGIVSFIFDDGYASISNTIVPLFKLKGFTCGFAISSALIDSSSTTYDTITNLLAHQTDGFEICNHGLDATLLQDTSKGLPFARSQINGNYNRLRQFGFDVQTWVTPNTTMHPSYLPLLEEYHASAYTVNGTSQFGVDALMDDDLDQYALKRPSLYQLFTDGGIQRIYDTIDAAIANDGWVCFYDHDPDQIGFPTSLSAANLELVLDYCVSQGILVLNPRDALDFIHSSTIKSRNIEQISKQARGVVNPNLMRDPWFKTVNEPYSGWGDLSGSGDATFTIAQRRNGIFTNEVALTVGSDGTIVDGEYIFGSNAQRRESDAFSPSGNLTYSCQPYVTVSDYNDFFEVTIGINQRKESDDSLIASVESSAIYVDTRARVHSVTISPNDYSSASYFTTYVRIKDKATGTSKTLVVANPKIEQGDNATPYTATAPVDINDWDFANSLLDVEVTPIPVGVFTKLLIADVNKNFYQLSSGVMTVRDTGFYSFDLQVTSATGGPYTEQRQLVELYKNGVAEGKRATCTVSGSTLKWQWSGTMFLKSGDNLEWRGYQDSSGPINTIDDTYSFMRICKIG